MNFWIELLISVLLIIGGLFVLVGSIGLIRLKDVYTRLHAPTKATTLGLGGILLASMVYMSHQHGYLSIHELLISLFLVITAPVTAHMLAKAALHCEVKMISRTRNMQHADTARNQQPPKTNSD